MKKTESSILVAFAVSALASILLVPAHGSVAELSEITSREGASGRGETTNAFGIYLTLEPVDGTVEPHDKVDLSRLKLDVTPVISADDIVIFDLTNRIMTLKPEAIRRVPRPSTRGTGFVVVAGGERIFLGAFWTGLSSFGPGLPTISVDDPMFVPNSLRFNSPRGLRPWSDPRIKGVLERLGKLKGLPDRIIRF